MKYSAIHLLFVLYVIIDAIWLRDLLFSATLPITRALQTSFGTPSFIAFNRFMAGFLNPDLCAVLNIFYFCVTPNKYRAMKQMLYQCIALYALIFYKIIMGDPRPYFVDSSIKGWECYADFGNPSGHSTSVWMFYGIAFTDIYNQLTLIQKKETHRSATKVIMSFIFAFLFISIVFCRIFLGVHSLNQVIIGSLFGIYIYFIYITYGDKSIDWVLNNLRSTTRSVKEKILWLTLSFIVSLQIPVALYEFLKRDVPFQWRDNIRISCPHFEEHQMFYQVCFKGCATIAVVFGTLFGLTLFPKTNHLVFNVFTSKQYQQNYSVISVKNALRALANVVIFVTTFIIFYAVFPVKKFLTTIETPYSKYYSMALGGFFGIGLFLFALPYLFTNNQAIIGTEDTSIDDTKEERKKKKNH